MLDPALIDILACPETQQPVTQADEALVKKINDAIASGNVLNRDQKKLDQAIDALLIREDEQYAYPVMNGIPVLIVGEGIDITTMQG